MFKNSIFNVGGYVISVVAAFLIAPITIHSLGDARYGAWSLVAELVGYYGLLDLGIRGAVTRFVAMYSARQRQDAVRETVASAFWVLVVCGLFAFLAGVGLTAAFPYLFKVNVTDVTEVQFSLLIMSALIAFSIPMNALGGSLIGKERFDIATSVEAFNRILTTVCYYFVLRAGGGLVALASVQAGARVISWVLTLIACKKVFGEIYVNRKSFRKERVRELFGYGFRNAIGEFALLLIYRVDLTVVGMFAGLTHVAFYTIGSTLVSYVSSLCSQITYVFTPRFTQLESTGQGTEVQSLYFFGIRVVGMIVTGMTAGLLVFGKDFIQLWLGEKYVNGPWQSRSDMIMVILMMANLPRMLQSVSWQRLFATGHVRFLMWLNVCEAIFNLVLSITLVHYFGPAGVAMGTLFPLIVSHVFVMPIYSSRTFGFPVSKLLNSGLAIPAMTGLLMACINLACIRIAPPTTWLVFFTDVLVAVAIGVVVCVAIGLSHKEREQLITMIWRRPSTAS